MLGEGQRGGQAGRLDSKEVHEAPHAVPRWPAHEKVRRRLPWPRDLGPDAGVVRDQRVVREGGPVSGDAKIKII